MDGYFRLGMVNQHKHLLKQGDQCIGGGYYHFDFVSNRIILDRESYDFGRSKWHLLEVLKVPSTIFPTAPKSFFARKFFAQQSGKAERRCFGGVMNSFIMYPFFATNKMAFLYGSEEGDASNYPCNENEV